MMEHHGGANKAVMTTIRMVGQTMAFLETDIQQTGNKPWIQIEIRMVIIMALIVVMLRF